jgi:uncharacterized protein YjaG (DUF416 family)
MKTKFGILPMDDIEYNVMQVSLDHMLEHLNNLIDDVDKDEVLTILERINACKRLINSIK